jgi:hypothetical protein
MQVETTMSVFTKASLISAVLAAVATLGVWLIVMPDEPERAADDGIVATAIASLVVTEKVRRDLNQS